MRWSIRNRCKSKKKGARNEKDFEFTIGNSTYAYNGDTTNLKKIAFPVNNPFEND